MKQRRRLGSKAVIMSSSRVSVVRSGKLVASTVIVTKVRSKVDSKVRDNCAAFVFADFLLVGNARLG